VNVNCVQGSCRPGNCFNVEVMHVLDGARRWLMRWTGGESSLQRGICGTGVDAVSSRILSGQHAVEAMCCAAYGADPP